MDADEPGGGRDFVEWLTSDTSSCIFRRLDDPADVVRAAAVSRNWLRSVIANESSKALFLRKFPEAATFTSVIEVTRSPAPACESSGDANLRALEKEHRIYTRLAGALISTKPSMDCIVRCITASSTDNFPSESMEHTLIPVEKIDADTHSYWSSGGQDDPDIPESLFYRLSSNLCVINEFRVRPYQASFQPGHPIYSSKLVRIRVGHSKLPPESESFVTDQNENLMVNADENYVWTYTSPEFPMKQRNELQSFKLPRPVLCIGGTVKIELLGRVQKQFTDDRYYICVCHAQVMGRSLSPDFEVEISGPARDLTLKYLKDAEASNDAEDKSSWAAVVARYRQMRHMALMNMLLGPVFMDEDDPDGVTDEDLYM